MGSVDSTVMIEPDLWTYADQIAAMDEGWMIHATPIPHISRTFASAHQNPARPFVSDRQADEYVNERAHQGSEFHQRALIALMKAILNGND